MPSNLNQNNPRPGSYTFEQIPSTDKQAEAACQRRLDQLTKPPGSLGLLETLALRLAGIQGFAPHVNAPAVLVFAADHGVTDEGVSAYPKAVTAQMVANFLSGGAAINVLAKLAQARVTVVDVGVDADLTHLRGLVHGKIRRGTRNMARENAMTREEVLAALDTGRIQACEAISRGADILCLGEMGIGNTTAAAALVSCLLPLDVSASVGRGTGIDDAGYERKCAAVGKALQRQSQASAQSHSLALAPRDAVLDVLQALGGLEIAALCGACLGAAARRIPVLVDGYIVSSAALCAIRLDPAVLPYLIFAHRSVEPGHTHLLKKLGVRPLLECGLRLGEGTGAVLALPLVKAACAILTEMATFKSAGVSNTSGGTT